MAEERSETFPVADWVNRAMWRTPAENRVADELDKLGTERATILAELEERQQQLEAEFADAKQSAETNERLLLTRVPQLVSTRSSELAV